MLFITFQQNIPIDHLFKELTHTGILSRLHCLDLFCNLLIYRFRIPSKPALYASEFQPEINHFLKHPESLFFRCTLIFSPYSPHVQNSQQFDRHYRSNQPTPSKYTSTHACAFSPVLSIKFIITFFDKSFNKDKGNSLKFR